MSEFVFFDGYQTEDCHILVILIPVKRIRTEITGPAANVLNIISVLGREHRGCRSFHRWCCFSSQTHFWSSDSTGTSDVRKCSCSGVWFSPVEFGCTACFVSTKRKAFQNPVFSSISSFQWPTNSKLSIKLSIQLQQPRGGYLLVL